MDQNEALLEAIYADPDDDALRLVYMDYLQDRGDPRGEFISLPDEAARPRADARGGAHRAPAARRTRDPLGG